jgi:hypothetical protein
MFLKDDLGLVGDAKWLIARPLFLDDLQLAEVPCNVNLANFSIKMGNSGFFKFNQANGFSVAFTGAVDVLESYLFSMRFRTILYQKLNPDEGSLGSSEL